jgi:hypothetical protein
MTVRVAIVVCGVAGEPLRGGEQPRRTTAIAAMVNTAPMRVEGGDR